MSGVLNLVSAEETRSGRPLAKDEFLDAIDLIQRRCRERGAGLVVRDWTHLDFTGLPFVRSPSYRLQTAELLQERFDLAQAVLVRHPLHQLTSLKRLRVIQGQWDEEAIVRGARRFAEQAVRLHWFRYEDFLAQPDETLRQICHRLGITFDPGYLAKWRYYDKVTGETHRDGRLDSDLALEPWDEELLCQLPRNEDYRAALELLGYDHPDLPREQFLDRLGDAHVLTPADVQKVFEEGNRLSDARRWEAAVRCYQRVLEAEPKHWSALNNMGFCLTKLKKYDWAVLQLQRALDCNADSPLALVNLVTALEEGGRRFEAVPYLRRLNELEPQAVNHPFRLSNLLVPLGRVAEALFYCRRVLQLQPTHYSAACNYLLYLNYSDRETVDRVAAEHFRLAQKWSRPSRRSPKAFLQSRQCNRRLRIGYVSRDFYTHPVGKLMAPLIAAHSRTAVEVYCYFDGDKQDVWTDKTEAASASFQRTGQLKDEELERRIVEDQIDVLVDLGGYTSGGNRLNVFAAGAAPIQIAFLGFPNTSGLTAMDYRITDAYCDPPGQTERWFTEKLIRLERGFLCYSPPDELPAVLPTPAKANGFVTFGSFNNIAKISETALATWAKILQRVPDARLVFKYGDRYESGVVCERIRSLMADADVDPARLRFLPSQASMSGHLKVLAQVDMALDSFPYQGTMTTLETLCTGVPVITLCGETYVRRASSALLQRLGLDDLLAETPDEYADIAIGLAGSVPLLNELRLGLREQFLASEICDVKGFVHELEDTYRRLWRDWCGRYPTETRGG